MMNLRQTAAAAARSVFSLAAPSRVVEVVVGVGAAVHSVQVPMVSVGWAVADRSQPVRIAVSAAAAPRAVSVGGCAGVHVSGLSI